MNYNDKKLLELWELFDYNPLEDNAKFDIEYEQPKPLTSNDYKKYPSLKSVKDNSWRRLFKELIGEMNPVEIKHGGSVVFDKYDFNRPSVHGSRYGKALYAFENPSSSRNFGENISRFYINPYKDYANINDLERIVSQSDIPYFTKDGTINIKASYLDLPKERPNNTLREWAIKRMEIPQERYNKYVRAKGYTGYAIPIYNGATEYVIFNPDIDAKPANTPLQRFLNRIPTQTLGKMATKAYNIPAVKQAIRFLPALGTAEMIYQGLEQPVGRAEFTPEEILMLDKGQPLQGGVRYYE